MGDVSTHAEISGNTAAELRTSPATSRFSPSELVYLELGNFLTDLSQFADPPALHLARRTAVGQVMSAVTQRMEPVVARVVALPEVEDWATDVFGAVGNNYMPLLPEPVLIAYLRNLARAFTHAIFSASGSAALTLTQALATSNFRALPAAEVDRIFGSAFTQYWPHEHLDFPPFQDTRSYRRLPFYQPSQRGLLGYLETQLQALAEEFARLEDSWTRSSRDHDSDYLVKLGHLLHTIEDYFFHSNYIEARQWARIRQLYPRVDPSTAGGLAALNATSLEQTRYPSTSVRLRRLLNRRLRYPIFENGAKSTASSDAAYDLVYTGAFGSTDLYHTIGHALDTLQTAAAANTRLQGLRTSPVVLFRMVFDPGTRMAFALDPARLRDEHEQQMVNGTLSRRVDAGLHAGAISPETAAALHDAISQDLSCKARHSQLPMPSSLLLTVLSDIELERSRSSSAAQSLDSAPPNTQNLPTSNGASSEAIGTHSLMAKDAVSEEPFRPDAVALAKHASASVALGLLERIAHGSAGGATGLDWLGIVRHFVRPPSVGSSSWEEAVCAAVRSTSSRQPAMQSIPDGANWTTPAAASLTQQLLAGHASADMKRYYASSDSWEPMP